MFLHLQTFWQCVIQDIHVAISHRFLEMFTETLPLSYVFLFAFGLSLCIYVIDLCKVYCASWILWRLEASEVYVGLHTMVFVYVQRYLGVKKQVILLHCLVFAAIRINLLWFNTHCINQHYGHGSAATQVITKCNLHYCKNAYILE